jgi:hypothetical protein
VTEEHAGAAPSRRASRSLEDTGQTDPDNVETRIWRPSLPVIHIASAVHLFLQLGFPSIDQLGWETFLFNQWVVECVIRAAEYHASIITNTNGLPIDPARLITMRLVAA